LAPTSLRFYPSHATLNANPRLMLIAKEKLHRYQENQEEKKEKWP
jgi:hypothetical protein